MTEVFFITDFGSHPHFKIENSNNTLIFIFHQKKKLSFLY